MTLLIALLLMSHMGCLNGLTATLVVLLWIAHLIWRAGNE